MTSKQLLLLRHAKSDWDSGTASDFERPLSKRGRQDAPRMGDWLAQNGYLPERIIASPSARTTETVELVCAALDEAAGSESTAERVIYEQRLYHASGEQIRKIAAEQLQNFDRVLVVAHNPGMELALHAYCPTAKPFADGKLMPTCALAVIEFPQDTATGKLQALKRPSDL